MTVSSEVTRNSYNGNSSQTVFPYTFRILDEEHILVVFMDANNVETIAALTTDYTVSDVGEAAGGDITCVVAPATGTQVIILRNIPITQEEHYVENDPFPALAHETALDRLAMESQMILERMDRAVRLPVGVDVLTFDAKLPNPAGNGGLVLAVNEAEDAFEYIINGTGAGGGGGGASDLEDLTDVTFTSLATNDFLVKSSGNWINKTPAAARTSMGVVIGTNVQAYNANLTTLAAATITAQGYALLDDSTASAQRSTLGLADMATQSSASVAITGGTVAGITDLAIADGGTNSSTAIGGFNNLSPQTTKGDLITRNLSTAIRLGVGSDNDILVADSTASGGLAWRGPRTITYEFNVKSYGALGDNSTDDTVAIAAAYAALVSAGGGKLKFPCGIYKYSSPITISNVPLEIVGDGRDLSWLVYTGTGNGIVFTSTGSGSNPNNISGHGTPLKSLKIKSCTVAAANAGNYGIYGTWADSTNNESLCSFEDVSVRNAYATTNYWTKAIYLVDTNGTHFRDVFVSGDESAYTTQTATPWNCTDGIHIHSTGSASSISHYFSNMSGGNCDKYLNITGPCEGVYMTNCELVSVGYGIAAPNGGLNLFGTNVHMDFRLSSVVAVGWNNVQFVNSDLQRNGGLSAITIINGNVMDITTCEGFDLVACRVRGLTSGGAGVGLIENGIKLTGVTRGAITGCHINDIADAGILIDSTSSYITMTGNVFSYCEYGIYNSSTTGILHGNNVFNNISGSNVFGTFSNGLRGAFVSRSSTQSLSSGVDTPIDFTATQFDTDGFLTSTSRFTIPTGKGITLVKLSGSSGVVSNATGSRGLTIRKNGSGNYIGRGGMSVNAAPSADTYLEAFTAIISVTAGDYFELAATQNSGSTLTTVGGREWFMIEVIS
jgi:hypothetical protein